MHSLAVNGNWGSWGSWSACSVTCSVGVRKRTRKCDNPKPQYNGRKCNAADGVATQSCDTFKNCRGGWPVLFQTLRVESNMPLPRFIRTFKNYAGNFDCWLWTCGQ